MVTYQASACHEVYVFDAKHTGKIHVRRGLALGRIVTDLFYPSSLLMQGLPASVWLSRIAVMVGLALVPHAGPARAAGLHDPAEIEAHAQSTVTAQLVDMGVEDTLFRGVRSVVLPRAEGPSGVTVCGTVEDMDGDLSGNVWGMHFIAFYERDAQGEATLVDEPVFIRIGQPGNVSADGLCDAAVATAIARLGPRVAGMRP